MLRKLLDLVFLNVVLVNMAATAPAKTEHDVPDDDLDDVVAEYFINFVGGQLADIIEYKAEQYFNENMKKLRMDERESSLQL